MPAPTRERSPRRDRNGRRRTAGSEVPLLAFRVFGIPHLAHRMRLIHQPLQVIDETFAAVLRVLVMAADTGCFLRAGFLAVATEDAAEFVDLENERVAIPFLILAGHELDAVGGTDRRAETASDAPG